MSPEQDSKGESKAQAPEGAGKRKYDRFDWKTRVQVLWIDEHGRGTSVIMRTQDLSAGGIALLSSSWVNIKRCGAVLLLDGPNHRSVRWIEVLHGRYVPDRKAHVIGCRWIATPENAPPVRINETASGPRIEFDTDLVPKMI